MLQLFNKILPNRLGEGTAKTREKSNTNATECKGIVYCSTHKRKLSLQILGPLLSEK